MYSLNINLYAIYNNVTAIVDLQPFACHRSEHHYEFIRIGGIPGHDVADKKQP